MRIERNGDDIYHFIALWNVFLHSEVPKGKKNSGRIRNKSKYKSITRGYCKCYLAKYFIFLDKKTMRICVRTCHRTAKQR